MKKLKAIETLNPDIRLAVHGYQFAVDAGIPELADAESVWQFLQDAADPEDPFMNYPGLDQWLVDNPAMSESFRAAYQALVLLQDLQSTPIFGQTQSEVL